MNTKQAILLGSTGTWLLLGAVVAQASQPLAKCMFRGKSYTPNTEVCLCPILTTPAQRSDGMYAIEQTRLTCKDTGFQDTGKTCVRLLTRDLTNAEGTGALEILKAVRGESAC
ncbi:MAG: hypothetical protein AAF441_04115 [Pseudomonadota bacterium]